MSDREKVVGTIFMGPQEERETTLQRLYEASPQEVWTKRTEEEYMERVKAKATERVRALLIQARHRGTEIVAAATNEAEAIRAEAEALRAEAGHALEEARAFREDVLAQRESAHQEGFAAGQAEAMALLGEARKGLGETTAIVLMGIQEQCGAIFEAWRTDMVELLKEAVEKGTGLIVKQDRAAVLQALLEQSMRALLDRSQYTVKVNPEDGALLTDMLADAHQASPRTANWELATDPALPPGSLVVESSTALVDNSRQARQSVVDEVLQHLSLPLSQADQDALNRVTNTMVTGLRNNGVDFSEGQAQDQDQQQAQTQEPAQAEYISPEAQAAAQFVEPDLSQTGSEPEQAFPEASAEFTAAADFSTPEEPLPDDLPPPQPEDLFEAAQSAPEMDLPPEPLVQEEPLAATPQPEQENHEEMAHNEAQDLVQEFLGDPEPLVVEDEANPGLPPEVADDLLAEMGFGDDQAPA